MNIFDIHDEVLNRYGKYVRSFLSIADDDIRAFVAQELLEEHALWPEVLLQFNPTYE